MIFKCYLDTEYDSNTDFFHTLIHIKNKRTLNNQLKVVYCNNMSGWI